MTTASATAYWRQRIAATALAVRVELAVPILLYLVALPVCYAAAMLVAYPGREGSAYYVAVAGNIAAGRGLVIDSIWSYATPPLILPRPAFELWQPLASLMAAVPMALLGRTFSVAQLAGVVVGAAVAPLAWAITREAGRATGTPPERLGQLAIGGGLVATLAAPFLVAVAMPESTLPFLIFGTLSCWLAARAASGRLLPALALGVALGLSYLARHEAIYIGAVVLAAAIAERAGLARLLRRLAPPFIAGGLVVAPWLLRNLLTFGTPLPGQVLDNALMTNNEQIFAYASPPTLAGFMAQGLANVVGNIVIGGLYNVIDVLLLPATPVSLVGLVGVLALIRRGGLRGTALAYLLGAGGLTLLVTSAVFPVASLWGTFLHAAGPLLVGLAVAAVLVGDRVVDAIRRRRGWLRANIWLAPAALIVVAAPLTLLQLAGLDAQARATQRQYAALAAVVNQQPELTGTVEPVVISDHPVWLNAAGGPAALALPAEPPASVLELAHDFGATLIVLGADRGPYPQGFRSGPLSNCFVELPLPADVPAGASLFEIAQACR
jgi:hypothetical protein